MVSECLVNNHPDHKTIVDFVQKCLKRMALIFKSRLFNVTWQRHIAAIIQLVVYNDAGSFDVLKITLFISSWRETYV